MGAFSFHFFCEHPHRLETRQLILNLQHSNPDSDGIFFESVFLNLKYGARYNELCTARL